MEYIKLQKINSSYQVIEKSSDTVLEFLIDYLIDIGQNKSNIWQDWLNDPKNDTATTDSSDIEKNERVLIYDIFSVSSTSPHISLDRKRLSQIVISWWNLCKEQPNEIIITKNGDDIIIKGKN
jgi:hypothetical protein